MNTASRSKKRSTSNGSSKKSELILACLWLLAFYLFFYAQALPNAQSKEDGTQPTRWDIWKNIDYFLLENIAPVREPNAPPSGWSYFPERLGFLLIAASVYLVAYCFGNSLFLLARGKPKTFKPVESIVLYTASGLSALSLLTLGLGLAGVLNRSVFIGIYLFLILLWVFLSSKSSGGFEAWKAQVRTSFLLFKQKISDAQFPITSPQVWGPILIAPFLLAIYLGAMLPSTDFDVKEYHFGGPKEYYLAGQIEMLPHNVYTSFPFLTEMLTLMGMVFYGDWYWGAVAGKTILAGFAPLVALTIFAFLSRRWGTTTGWLGAIIYLSIPWTYRISIIAYTEGGLSLFLASTVLATAVSVSKIKKGKPANSLLLLTGFLAGSAASCKYPG